MEDRAHPAHGMGHGNGIAQIRLHQFAREVGQIAAQRRSTRHPAQHPPLCRQRTRHRAAQKAGHAGNKGDPPIHTAIPKAFCDQWKAV